MMNAADIRISLGGHIFIMTTIGILRGFTSLEAELGAYMGIGVGKTSLLVVAFCLGSAIAGFFPSVILPITGLKNAVYLSGLTNCLAYALIGLTLNFKNIYLLSAIIFTLAGLPAGLAQTAVFTSARERGSKEYMGFIMTLEFAGISTACFVQPLYFTWLIDRWGIQNAFYGIAVFQLLNIFSGLLILDEEEKLKKDDTDRVPEKPKFISFKLLKNQCYALFAIFQGGYGIGWSMMIPYLESFLIFLTFEKSQATWLVAYIGIIEAISRLVYAVITDKVHKITLLLVTVIGNAVALSLGVFVHLFSALAPYKLYVMIVSFTLTGFFDAGYGGLANAVLVDITDDSNYKVAQGMNQFLMAFYCVIGPLVGGVLVDLCSKSEETKEYWVTFLVGSLSMVFGGLVAWRLKCVAAHVKREKSEEDVALKKMDRHDDA